MTIFISLILWFIPLYIWLGLFSFIPISVLWVLSIVPGPYKRWLRAMYYTVFSVMMYKVRRKELMALPERVKNYSTDDDEIVICRNVSMSIILTYLSITMVSTIVAMVVTGDPWQLLYWFAYSLPVAFLLKFQQWEYTLDIMDRYDLSGYWQLLSDKGERGHE